MTKDKNYYLNQLERFATFLEKSDEPLLFHPARFCELTKTTNKTYTVQICTSAFEDLPLVIFETSDDWYWDPTEGGRVKLRGFPQLDVASAVMEFFSMSLTVFKHFFCLHNQLPQYGAQCQLTSKSSLKDMAQNIKTYIQQQRHKHEETID